VAGRGLLIARTTAAAAALCAAAAACVAGAGGAASPRVAVVVDAGAAQAVALLSPGGRVVSRIPVARGIRSLAWRPSGGKLVVSTGGGNLSNELRVIDLAGGGQRTLAGSKRASPAAFFGSVAWSPNGRSIAVTRSPELYGAEIDVIDASTGKLLRALRVGARLDGGLSWSRDGSALYFTRQPKDRAPAAIGRVGLATGTAVRLGAGLDPQVRADGAIAFTAPGGIVVRRHGRAAGSRKGDRLAAWLSGGKTLLAERPATPGCPRQIHPACSHVVVLAGGTARLLLPGPARNPATR
jgi:DNA-binding beta-propeller fold protein YncE